MQRENVETDALKEWKINIFKIIDTRISFYSRNTHHVPRKPKYSFRHLKRGIQDFHINYENQDKVPTLYWLPKLHKNPYKARLIAYSSSCTTTELSKLLTSCLTAVKKHVIKYCEKEYERSGKNLFWSIKIQVKF